MFKKLSASCLVVVFLMGCIVPHVFAQDMEGGRKVVIGQINVSFYAVVGALIQQVLERKGYAVEIRQGPHQDMYPALGRGDFDLFVAAWLPHAHGMYWEEVKGHAVTLSVLYENAQLFWAVPEYVPESAVQSVEDLLKAEVVEKMTKTIQGTGPGSGLMMGSSKMMAAYGLDKAGYVLRPGTAQEWVETFTKAIGEKRWVVIPIWRPQYLNKTYRLRALIDRKGLLGGPNTAHLVAHRDFMKKAPATVLETLRRIYIGLDAVTEMDYMVNEGKMIPQEAARVWMKQNSAVVESWFKQ